MNEITKIDTKNGVLEKGILYHSAGLGGDGMKERGIKALGGKSFFRYFVGHMNKGWWGNSQNTKYYLTTKQAEKWNAYIEEQDQLNKTDPLMERAIELAVDGIEILGYGRPEGYEIKEGYEYDYIDECWPELNVWQPRACGITNSRRILFQRKIKEESEPDLSHLNKGQLTKLEHDSWVEQLTGNKPVDPHGSNYGIMCQMARALYGKGGDQ